MFPKSLGKELLMSELAECLAFEIIERYLGVEYFGEKDINRIWKDTKQYLRESIIENEE